MTIIRSWSTVLTLKLIMAPEDNLEALFEKKRAKDNRNRIRGNLETLHVQRLIIVCTKNHLKDLIHFRKTTPIFEEAINQEERI